MDEEEEEDDDDDNDEEEDADADDEANENDGGRSDVGCSVLSVCAGNARKACAGSKYARM